MLEPACRPSLELKMVCSGCQRAACPVPSRWQCTSLLFQPANHLCGLPCPRPYPHHQALQLSDPGFKFGTRQQALRDRPWKDWQGVTFLPVSPGAASLGTYPSHVRPPCRRRLGQVAVAAGYVQLSMGGCMPTDNSDHARLLQGKRYSVKEFQDVACATAAKRFGGLHGCLPTRTIEVRAAVHTTKRTCQGKVWTAVCAAVLLHGAASAATTAHTPHLVSPLSLLSPNSPAQREYWREREKAVGAPLLVEYGNDVDGTLFTEEDRLGSTRWNLNVSVQPGASA